MDQAFLEREKELVKLNAKLNSKAKKITSTNRPILVKPVQIHTANNYFNYYDESLALSQKESQDDGLELLCKKINISNQPVKRNHEIIYPLFNRQTSRGTKDQNISDIHIHLPGGLMVADGKAESIDTAALDTTSVDFKSEVLDGLSFKNESLLTRCSDDSSAFPPAAKIAELPMASITNNVVPRSIEKKNISNDGLLKFLKSKVALLQTELEAGKNLNDTLEKENAKHIKKIKKLTTQVDKSSDINISLESALKAVRDKQETCEQNLKAKEAVIVELNRELLAVNKDRNDKNHNLQVLEKQLLKTKEDLEMLTSKFEAFKDIEVIMRESAKDDRVEYEEKIKRLRKGRMDLLKAYKQQLILIDNLRRQNVCLEKAKALEIAEKEFLKVLDWNLN